MTCPNGFWGKPGIQGLGGVCESCPSTCYTCHGPLECTVCRDQYYLQDGQCLPTCPEGHYHVGDTDVGRVCEHCPVQCKSCVSEDVCTECQDSLYLTPASTCESSCPDGHYKNYVGKVGSTCPACTENCSLCTNATYCTQCRNSTYLTPEGKCEPSCPDGFFGDGEDEIGRTCKPCAAPCNKCLSETHCTECRQSTYLNPLTSFCDATCSTGYYSSGVNAIGRTCEPCAQNCEKCESKDWCTECKNFQVSQWPLLHRRLPGRILQARYCRYRETPAKPAPRTDSTVSQITYLWGPICSLHVVTQIMVIEKRDVLFC